MKILKQYGNFGWTRFFDQIGSGKPVTFGEREIAWISINNMEKNKKGKKKY